MIYLFVLRENYLSKSLDNKNLKAKTKLETLVQRVASIKVLRRLLEFSLTEKKSLKCTIMIFTRVVHRTVPSARLPNPLIHPIRQI